MAIDVTRPRAAIVAAAVCGLVAGLVAALYFTVAGEPRIEDAIAIEEAAAQEAAGADGVAGDDGSGGPEVSRSAQRGVGLFAGMGLSGAAFGLLLGVAWVAQRQGGASPFRRALLAGAGLFASITLLPWFKYPPNPPAVGDPDTIDGRQVAYVALICITGVVVLGAVRLHQRLRHRPEAERIALTAAGVVVPLALALWLLPANDDPVEVPATLIWQFRTVSLAGNALLWGVLTVGFGLLAARSVRADGSRAANAEPALAP